MKKKNNINTCKCGNKSIAVVIQKIITQDFLEQDSFGKYFSYYCECNKCGNKTENYLSSQEAIEHWNFMNPKKGTKAA